MEYFKKYNNLVGWVVFAISLVAYVLTTEPTASWWDCMEFTATSYKLEVGHPPGAPLFMMITRLFTMLSMGNTALVGFTANLMSCVASAFCILFMFWTITRLARKMEADGWTAIGAGVIGALGYAFTDTFWFSAVESEVYALSSMFTALVVWLMMRWEEVADEQGNERWLILIAYMMGLSIGVHILNLLTIPALVFIYYFRKTQTVTIKGVLLALVASGGILLAIYKVIMPWTVNAGAWVDRVFVNSLSLPVNSGLAVWCLLVFAMVGAGVWLTHRRGMRLANTILLCVGVILIGYSSYASVVIRSSVNPPMNSNRPDNAYALLSLMGREQYGTNDPLLYGHSYTSIPVESVESKIWYMGANGQYKSRTQISGYKFAEGMEGLFPRLYDHGSKSLYEAWMGKVKMRPVRIAGYDKVVEVPTFGEHLRYFFTYQMNYMYWRYFMWNFVGRQDDIQGVGDILHGNWLSGVTPIDEMYLGSQTNLPDEVKRNPGRNKFYFLPFILGILGLIAQAGKDKRGFSIVMWMFVMMGVVLVLYFNIKPSPPRERDYIYAGSFYAFSIWMGLAVVWLREVMGRWMKSAAPFAATAVCMVVPVLLAAQGWDDHDRSGRSMGNALGYNELVSTLPNSIIMNYGDNDTFPLWYNQEVENVRPDVRIMNMSYIAGDWYIEQMKHAYNDSAPVPLTIPIDVYRENPQVEIREVLDYALPLRTMLDFVANRDNKTRMQFEDGSWADYIPARKVILPVNKANALASGIVRPEDADLMVDSIEFTLPEGSIGCDQLVLLDLLSNFDWNRPLYFTYPSLLREIGLGDWLQADGWAYRFVPIRTKYDYARGIGRIDTERMYDLVMNKYKYGGSGTPGVEVDWNSVINLQFVKARYTFTRLANDLIARGDTLRAVEVLDRGLAEYPHAKFDYDANYYTFAMIEAYYAAGATEKADEQLDRYASTLRQYVEYYLRFDGAHADAVADLVIEKLRDLDSLALLAGQYGRRELFDEIDAYLDVFDSDKKDTESPAAPAAADSLK